MLVAATLAAEMAPTIEPVTDVLADGKSVEQLLQELQAALVSQRSELFQDASISEKALDHLNFDFDLVQGTITAKTEMADENGQPLY